MIRAVGGQVAAYRNYGSGKTMILEHSRWESDPEKLLDFLQAACQCLQPTHTCDQK